jgi:deazaflavin-dependent oxidoreductase (nitroreductase family)
LDDKIQRALTTDRTIDITTIGRKTGVSRRIEIWFFNLDGKIYITGSPGKRSWYANLRANPDFTFHLKGSVKADLPARARAILDEAERRGVLRGILDQLEGDRNLDTWVAESPLVEVTFK